MKKRFRKYVREGWYLAQVERKNLWNFNKGRSDKEQWGDEEHYRHLRAWCAKTFAKNSWEGRLLPNAHWATGEPVTKEFVFAHERDKLMFMLKWFN
jgi:hypothetical protein